MTVNKKKMDKTGRETIDEGIKCRGNGDWK